MVALDALAKFSSMFHSKRISLRTAYSFNGVNYKPIIVNQANRLLSQKYKLLTFSENKTNILSYAFNGSGSALIQLSVKYNIKKENKKLNETSFNVKIESFKSTLGAECQYASIRIHSK